MRIYKSILFVVVLFLTSSVSYTQTGNTVGLLLNAEDSFNGYTMLTPINSDNTYLIDNCGHLVNKWVSEYRPALSAHLTEWGTLIRSGRIENDFQAGGSGGIIQEFDWFGNLIWEAVISTATYHQHHDIKPMPNGNILVLAWELNSSEDAILLGRDTDLITDEGIWTEMILEIQPVGNDDFIVKWEWHLNDHLIQDIDMSLDNFGDVSQHPELVDLNYPHKVDGVDLFHANALDYNSDLDQIVINSRNYNEFYIIDHSTTIDEAAGHIGGNSGHGGDILYRYGNPATYMQGDSSNQKFFHQHGANWVKEGIFKNSVIVFDNGRTMPDFAFSAVEIVTPTWNGTDYNIEPNTAFGPEDYAFEYVGTPTPDFTSPRLSNAVVLPNDNVLVCVGQKGKLYEIDQNKEIVWEYINPVLGNNIAQQGDNNPNSDVFATQRYPTDFSGLPAEIEPQGPIEFFSNYDCDIQLEVVNVHEDLLVDVKLVVNPILDMIEIEKFVEAYVKLLDV